MAKTHEKNTYHVAIDLLRVLAILGVILIHTTTLSLNVSGYHVEKTAWSLFLNQTARFAVPLFFLISGFVLELNYKEKVNYATYFKKRASKIIIPYFFWTAFYFVVINKFPLSDLLSFSFAKNILLGIASYQLYFIPTLIIFYLLFPIFHKALPLLSKKIIFFPLVLIQIIILAVDYYILNLPVITPFRVAAASYLLFLGGMIASHHKEKILTFIEKNARLFFTLFFFSTIFVFLQSQILFLQTRKIGYIYSQYHIANYIFTLLLTGLLFYYFDQHQRFKNYIVLFSRLSFFVFFVHVAILSSIWNTFGKKVVEHSGTEIVGQVWFDPLLFITVTSASFAIAFVIHKIPNLNKLTG